MGENLDNKKLHDDVSDRSEKGLKSYTKGYSFENQVAELYRLLRYDVEDGRLFSGRQVDLFLTGQFGDLTIHRAIECKAGSVKAEDIDTFIAKLRLVRREYPSAQGTIVSAVSFTDAIASQAAQEGIQLTLYRDLSAQLFDGHGYARTIIRECESSERYPINLYIEPYVAYETTGPPIGSIEVLYEWLQDRQWNQLTLLGDVGTGKSFLSRMLAYRLAKDFLATPLEKPVPILIDLRNADRQFSLEGLILTHLAQNGLNGVSFEAFQHALSQGNIVLILDGFDEMAARVNPQVTNRNFHELARCVQGNAKVLLTCRTHYFKSRTEEEEVILGNVQDYGSETARDLFWELISRKGFKIAYLRPFGIPQIEEYIQRSRPNRAKEALDRIKNTYNLMELSQRPMLLEMIVKSIDKLTVSEINPATLYMVYTDAWVHRDQWRDVLSSEDKLSFLMALAHSLWHEDTVSVNYSRLIEYLQQKLATQIQNPQQLFELDNEIRTASFLTRDESGNYGFAHRSYAEFFLARYLASQLNRGNIDCLHTRRFSHEIISFLKHMIDLVKVTPLLENILQSNYRPLTSENALACLYGFQRETIVTKQQSSRDETPEPLAINLPHKIMLSGAQLDQMTLEGALFVEADLSNANLSQSLLARANLSRAIMQGANLEKADLTHAIMSSAQLSDAVLVGANLDGADLTNACLAKANLSDAFLLQTSYQGASLEGAIITRAILPDGLSTVLGRITDENVLRRKVLASDSLVSSEHYAIIEKLYPFIRKASRRMSVTTNFDSDDIAQDAVIALLSPRSFEKLGGLSDSEQRSYVLAIIKNLGISASKRGYSRELVNQIDVADMEQMYYEQSSSSLESIMEAQVIKRLEELLPAKFWRILKSHYLDGIDLNDIADREGISLSSLQRYLSKALDIARKVAHEGDK